MYYVNCQYSRKPWKQQCEAGFEKEGGHTFQRGDHSMRCAEPAVPNASTSASLPQRLDRGSHSVLPCGFSAPPGPPFASLPPHPPPAATQPCSSSSPSSLSPASLMAPVRRCELLVESVVRARRPSAQNVWHVICAWRHCLSSPLLLCSSQDHEPLLAPSPRVADPAQQARQAGRRRRPCRRRGLDHRSCRRRRPPHC